MRKIKIKIITLGHMPPNINLDKVLSWKSKILDITDHIENISIRCNSDGSNWDYSNKSLDSQIPADETVDFVFALTNVPLELNWYARRIRKNCVVLTFHEIKEYLNQENIPLENLALRALYSHALIFARSGNSIPDNSSNSSFTHDETRGCLFDMNGIKSDIVESCKKPVLCSECQERMRNQRVPNNMISATQNEIKKIRKNVYFRAIDFIKTHPFIALIISSAFALVIGTLGSIIASFIYDVIKNGFA